MSGLVLSDRWDCSICFIFAEFCICGKLNSIDARRLIKVRKELALFLGDVEGALGGDGGAGVCARRVIGRPAQEQRAGAARLQKRESGVEC